MATGLLIITHPGIGKALLDTATTMLDRHDLNASCIEVGFDADLLQIQQQAVDSVIKLNKGNGVLVLTDAYGATPSNVACQLLPEHQINIVTGINLPMLVKALNYADQDLDDLTKLAVEGGKQHIIRVSPQQCSDDQ